MSHRSDRPLVERVARGENRGPSVVRDRLSHEWLAVRGTRDFGRRFESWRDAFDWARELARKQRIEAVEGQP